MKIDEQVHNIIDLLNDGNYNHAKQSLDRLIEVIERKKTLFNKCNVCVSCNYLSKDDCTATKEIRLKKKINNVLNCEYNYQLIKYMDFIRTDPEEIKKREKLARELSYISFEDMFRPFTI